MGADAQNLNPNGASFGDGTWGLYPFDAGGSTDSLELTGSSSGLYLYAAAESSGQGKLDGGITLYGNPVNVVLGTDVDNSNPNRGVFSIWRTDKFNDTNVATVEHPYFKVDAGAQTAAFNGVNVSIVDGTLSVSGSPVVTQSTGAAFLGGLTGAIDIGNGTASHSAAIAIGQNSPLASQSGAIALGNGQATGLNSIAIGTSAVATASNSVALGQSSALGSNSLAATMGTIYSTAYGSTAVSGGAVEGSNNFAAGNGAYTRAFSSVALGTYPKLPAASESRSIWQASDPILTVGNGEWSDDNYSKRSNALKILKNGLTTLTNRKWNASTPLADPDASDSTDAGGKALSVEGHAEFKGKVILNKAQGDISMGIFQ